MTPSPPPKLRKKCDELAADECSVGEGGYRISQGWYKRGFRACWQEVEPVLRELKELLDKNCNCECCIGHPMVRTCSDMGRKEVRAEYVKLLGELKE